MLIQKGSKSINIKNFIIGKRLITHLVVNIIVLPIYKCVDYYVFPVWLLCYGNFYGNNPSSKASRQPGMTPGMTQGQLLLYQGVPCPGYNNAQ